MSEPDETDGPDDECSDPDECQRCGDPYVLRDGCEPTPFCDSCAHHTVDELRAELAEACELLNLSIAYLEGYRQLLPNERDAAEVIQHQERINEFLDRVAPRTVSP